MKLVANIFDFLVFPVPSCSFKKLVKLLAALWGLSDGGRLTQTCLGFSEKGAHEVRNFFSVKTR